MPDELSPEELKKKARCERFGTEYVPPAKVQPKVDKQAKRKAEKQAANDKKKSRADRFGTSGPDAGAEEKKAAERAARFGTAPTAALSEAEEAKRKARAERFN